MNGLRILIVGGGIGGLTAALCLHRAGHRVTLCEQAQHISEVGAGIQLSPNATRVLHHLGLEQALRKQAFLPQGTEFRHWRSGQVISQSVLGDALMQTYGAPYYHMHRGDLIDVLASAAERADGLDLLTRTRVSGFSQDTSGVYLQTAEQTLSGDLLIGADGIHSRIRESLWGAEQPVFTGNVAWRALVPADRLPAQLVRPTATVWWGPGKHFVHYYVRGGRLVNCVCVVEKSGWQVESWTERGSQAELVADFAGWHQTVTALIEQADADSLYKWALFDRPPMPHWSQQRATLLGDACHPTLPFMAQGAAMAIEDAAVLTGCLQHAQSVEGALGQYETLRRARTAAIQSGSRRNAKVFHLSGVAAWMRNRAAKRAGGKTMDQLYRYNALQAGGWLD